MVGEIDDFGFYSDSVRYPEGLSSEEVIKWFDGIFFAWVRDPGLFTSSGLLKAIRELSQHGGQFVLTLLPGQVPEGVTGSQRELPNNSGVIHDVSVKGIGFADRENPYFISVSQDFLTLSRRRLGLIRAFAPREIFGLRAVFSAEEK